MKTNKQLTFRRMYSAAPFPVEVSTGAPVVFENGVYYVDTNYFPKGSILRHDAEFHGFEVKKADIEFERGRHVDLPGKN